MIIFVEGNQVDILQFAKELKDSITFIEQKLRVNLDTAKDKVKVIEKMHEIMQRQSEEIGVLRKKLDSERKENCCCKTFNNEPRVEDLKGSKHLSEQVEELSRLSYEKRKLYDELQKEKTINRRLRNTIKNLVEGDDVGKKHSTPTFVEDVYIHSDQIIPREVIAGIAIERPKCL